MVKKFRDKYEIVGKKGPDDMDYTVNHTASIFLMGPDGKYIRRFSHISTPQDIAKGVEAAMQHIAPDPSTDQQP